MRSFLPSATLLALAACGQGQINIEPGDTDAPGNPDIQVVEVRIEPVDAYTNDDLQVIARAEAVNVDALTWRYLWEVDGQTIQDGPSDVLPATAHRRDQTVLVRAIATDGEWPSAAVASAPITILNSPPSMTDIGISPAEATAAGALTCTAGGFDDLDGDTVRARFSWWVNGAEIPLDSATFGPGAFRRDDVVSCSATPTDGTDDGERLVSDEVLIANAPPEIQALRIQPDPAFTNDTLTAEIVARDLDGDALAYGWSWTVNGVEVGSASGLPGSAFVRGDRVRVTATATDGIVRSAPFASAELTIRNSVPTAPGVEIDPPEARKGQALLCDVVLPSTDADGDRVTYIIDWYRDGVKYTGATRTTLFDGDTLPGSATKEGEVWTCQAQAWDRTDTSPWSDSSGEVEIAEGVWVFTIPQSQLLNQPFACWTGPERYTCNGGGYGFFWTDEADIPPDSIEIEYNAGFNCGVGTRTASINGDTVGSAPTGDSYNCGCRRDLPSWNKKVTYEAPESYEPGGRNEFLMTRTSCEGYSPEPDWAREDGTAIFARVTVRY